MSPIPYQSIYSFYICGFYFWCYYVYVFGLLFPPKKFYKGTIGTYPIVMKLDLSDKDYATAAYFYLKTRRDINLEVITAEDNAVSLVLKQWDTKTDTYKTSESFSLQRSGNSWNGTWQSATGKKLPVALKLVDEKELTGPDDYLSYIKGLKSNDLYEYLRIYDLNPQFDSISKQGTRTLQWYRHKPTDISLFQIKDGYPTQVLKAINDSLKTILFQEISHGLSCSSSIGEGEYTHSINEPYFSDDIVSININVGYYCGGAHPDFGLLTATYDASTGRELKLDQIIRFGSGAAPEEDSEPWFDYRNNVFAPAVVDLFKQLYPAEMRKPKEAEEDNCDYTASDVWNFPAWYLTPKGLYLGAYFARAARNCDAPGWSIIPYAELAKLRNPDYHFILP